MKKAAAILIGILFFSALLYSQEETLKPGRYWKYKSIDFHAENSYSYLEGYNGYPSTLLEFYDDGTYKEFWLDRYGKYNEKRYLADIYSFTDKGLYIEIDLNDEELFFLIKEFIYPEGFYPIYKSKKIEVFSKPTFFLIADAAKEKIIFEYDY